jgi:hypothetical protein
MSSIESSRDSYHQLPGFDSLQLCAYAFVEIAMRWWQSLLLYWNRWNEVI